MQHDLFGSGHDLDLRSPSKFDLSRSTLYHSTRLGETNTMVCESFLYRIRNKSYCRKTISVQKCAILTFNDVRRLNGWPEPKPKCILTKELDKSCRMLFPRLSSYSSFRATAAFIRKCRNRPNVTFDDLWWPHFWPDLKNDRSTFVMIFDELSNAAFPVSLPCLGATLDWECLNTFPSKWLKI